MSSRPVALFVCYGGGHVRMVLPVAREMEARGGIRPVILALTSARAEVEAAGFPCLGFADFIGPADAASLLQGEALARELQTLSIDLRESAAYLGLNWADLVRAEGAERASELYARYGRQCFLPVDTMERVLREVGPDVVVTTSAPRAERAAIAAARRLDLPSLCMVDLFAAYEVQWLREPGFADRICVLNEQVRDRLVASGRSAADIVVTGNPAFDRLADPALFDRGRALRNERGWENQLVVLWASQVEPESHPSHPGRGNPELPAAIAGELRRLLGGEPGMELVIRPHPSQPPAAQPGQEREWLSPSSEDVHVLLHACDVVVVLTSTVGLEARLAGKHVIQVLGSLYSDDAPYLAYGVADQAVPLAELGSALRHAAARRGQPAKTLPHRPGRAASLVTDQIMRLIAS